MHKRGISTLIATVLIIGITISAFGIVYTFVMPIIKENIEANRLCGDVKVMINTQKGYTCYNSSTGQVNLQVSRGSDAQNISSLQFKISGQGNSNTVDLIDGIKPIALWHMDEGPGAISIIDSSGNGNTGAIINGPYWIDGKLGSALNFDGEFPIDNNYVIIPDAPSLDITNEITMSAWIKAPSTPNGGRTILTKESTYLLAVRNDGYKFCYLDGVMYWTPSDTINVLDNTWHHIACTYNGIDFRLYIDGANTHTRTVIGSIIPNNNALSISTNSAEIFHGTIDEVAIWNKSLSPSDISNLYNSGNGQKSNLIEPNYLAGYWPLDEGSGISTVDSSGNGNNGILKNFKSSVEYTPSGKFGGAYEFDGEKGYIDGALNNFNSTNGTLELWIKPNWAAPRNSGGYEAFISLSRDLESNPINSSVVIEQHQEAGGKIGMWWTNKAGAPKWDGYNPATWDANTWHQIVISWTDTGDVVGTATIYLDGVSFATQTSIGQIDDFRYIYIGKYHQAGRITFNGTIDEVSIYDKALNAEEIKKLYGGYKIIDKVISPNGERTYVISSSSLNLNNVDSASVAPIVKVGNKEHVCSMMPDVVLEAC